jgi:AmmeMemoRadiSam system protein A
VLIEQGVASRVSETLLCDHSVEIQLPFVQSLLPGAKFVPLFVGRLRTEERIASARVLAGLATPGTVFVASSDLTHYGGSFHYKPFPVDSNTSERLREVDHGTIAAASSLDPEMFFDELSRSGSTVCGTAPISLLLETLRATHGPELFQETLDYQTSGDITGDFGHSVSYAALGYFPFDTFHLDERDREVLVESALRTIDTLRSTGRREPVLPEGGSNALRWRGGVFVSLYHNGELRGCVGRHVASEPLAEAVPDLTLSAACDDTRFHKTAGESLEVEISVMTPLKRVRSTNDVRAGQHGVYLEAGSHRALLLPQVATERNWNSERFLDALAQKAGARPDVFQDPATRLSVFRAQIFGNARKRPK